MNSRFSIITRLLNNCLNSQDLKLSISFFINIEKDLLKRFR